MDLDRLTRLGPFFQVNTHEPGAEPTAGWRPMSELVEQPGVMLQRIQAVRRALAASRWLEPEQVELRVAASVTHLGLVARLIAPALASPNCPDDLPDLTPSRVWWQDRLGGPVPLSVEPSASTTPAGLLESCLAPLTTSVADVVAVSARVLWGNIASGLNSAVTQIARAAPQQRDVAQQIAIELMADQRFRAERGSSPGPGFRRSSCCLIYRVPSQASAVVRRSRSVCGDCVLGTA